MADQEKPTPEKKRKFGGAQAGAGRPAFQPTDEERAQVKKFSGFGLPHDMIRLLVRDGIALETLYAHFRPELDSGKAQANADITGRLYAKAMAGDTSSLIWWTKAQLRWSETQKVEVTGADGGPVQTVDFSQLSTETLLELSKAMIHAAPEDHDGGPRLN
jgi:hypothetical protein